MIASFAEKIRPNDSMDWAKIAVRVGALKDKIANDVR